MECMKEQRNDSSKRITLKNERQVDNKWNFKSNVGEITELSKEKVLFI